MKPVLENRCQTCNRHPLGTRHPRKKLPTCGRLRKFFYTAGRVSKDQYSPSLCAKPACSLAKPRILLQIKKPGSARKSGEVCALATCYRPDPFRRVVSMNKLARVGVSVVACLALGAFLCPVPSTAHKATAGQQSASEAQ